MDQHGWTDRQVPPTIHHANSPRFHRLQVTHALPTCGRNGMNIPVCNAGHAIVRERATGRPRPSRSGERSRHAGDSRVVEASSLSPQG